MHLLYLSETIRINQTDESSRHWAASISLMLLQMCFYLKWNPSLLITHIVCIPGRHNQAVVFITSPSEGVARYFFSPGLSVCVSVRLIFWYFISRLLDIDLKFIQDTYRYIYRLVLDSLTTKMTFIGQRSSTQGRYITFGRYSHITKTEQSIFVHSHLLGYSIR